MYIYVLKLQNNKYYVGKTDNLKRRLNQHIRGNGATWTKLYKPIDIIDLMEEEDNTEKDITLKYMQIYGCENVRGYCWCQTTNFHKPIVLK